MRDRQTDRQTDRGRETDRQRERDRQTEGGRERERERETIKNRTSVSPSPGFLPSLHGSNEGLVTVFNLPLPSQSMAKR